MKKFNLLKLISAIMTASLLITGCSVAEEPEPVVETPTYEITYIEEMDNLSRDAFYVHTKDGYASPYFGVVSFEDGAYSDSTSPRRVAWFMDDFAMIPTIYKGEEIVYRTASEFRETFTLERFFDGGYTFGMCHLSKSQSGRYKLATSANAATINPNSDAAKLAKYGDIKVTIDAIDKTYLREGMVSASGTILNLKQGETYPIDLYVGTELQRETTVKADSRYLYGQETRTLVDFDYIRADIITIQMPEYMNSGYYSINGSGIFRYVNGDSYDSTTDFNIPNAASQEAYEAEKAFELAAVDEITKPITLGHDAQYKISVFMGEKYAKSLMEEGQTDMAPQVTMRYGNEVIDANFVILEDYTAVALVDARAGMYELDIKNLLGRACEVEAEDVGPYVENRSMTDIVPEQNSEAPQQEESSVVQEESSAVQENTENGEQSVETTSEESPAAESEETSEVEEDEQQ